MKHEFLVNGQVTLVLIPENDMEEQLISQLLKQNNDVINIRTTVQILGKTITRGLVMLPKVDKVSYAQETEDLLSVSEAKGNLEDV